MRIIMTIYKNASSCARCLISSLILNFNHKDIKTIKLYKMIFYIAHYLNQKKVNFEKFNF